MTDSTGTGTPWTSGSGRVWGRRVVQALGGLLLLFVAVTAFAVWWLDRSIDRVEVGGLGELPQQSGPVNAGDGDDEGDDEGDPVDDASAVTFLLLGSDSREDLTPEQRREFRTGNFDGLRTEVISLVRLSPSAEEVRILNVPRDSRVERCDGSVGKINAAYEIGEADGRGGATCTVETLTELTGLAIDHVVIVDFEGFVDVIDELGGVSMMLDEPLRDRGSHLDLPAGCVHLDGVDALAFARARQLDDDFGRIARQQRLIAEVRAELAEVGVLDDLPRLLRVVEAVAGSVELDSSLDLGALQQLVRQHRSTIQGDLDGRAVPGDLADIGGVSYVELDEDRLAELTRWLMSGVDPAAAAEPGEGAADAGEPRDEDGDARDAAAGEGFTEGGSTDDPGSGERTGPRTLGGQHPAGTAPSDAVGSC